ncbi:tyrosine-protein phosphatase non-receptor type 7-like [Saccostrea cucullata]|uniref:tyrosine-protein phosphatase non-receptor type 7-like n=1 Tax=Saccostrea cuccullata TaxID=36930 RepID=UPI002ED04FB6
MAIKKTEVVTISADSKRSKSSTALMDVFIEDNKVSEDRNNEGDRDQFPILLVTLSAMVVVLLVVVVILFVSRWNNVRSKKEKKSHPPKNLPRSESRNESELEENTQNEAGYVEEEVIVVEYSNLTSKRVSIEQVIKELPERKRNGTLEKEFNDLPCGLLESYSNALKISNRSGNRYKGIYPYDYNRVKLIRTEDYKDDDFVNASYIHGFAKERAYIAAQGPFNPKTLEDFWTVIWQNDSTRIVMLTSLYEGDKMECLKYWPDTELDVGPYNIRLDTVDVYDSYVRRYLIVQYQEEEKRVTQFHFTTWPDNSVPEDLTSLICFRNLVRNGMTSSDGPIVVHCSAGIGRTGTFIALDYLLEEGAAEQTIDVKGYVSSLRHQRGKSIQTCKQYIFLHDSLIEGFTNNSARRSVLSVL